jgi:hypothetical protein
LDRLGVNLALVFGTAKCPGHGRLGSSWHGQLRATGIRVRNTGRDKAFNQAAGFGIDLMGQRSHEARIGVGGERVAEVVGFRDRPERLCERALQSW